MTHEPDPTSTHCDCGHRPLAHLKDSQGRAGYGRCCGCACRKYTTMVDTAHAAATTIAVTSIISHYSTGGGHWFDADTLAFFGSRIERKAYDAANGRAYFVSSEQDESGFGSLGQAWGGQRRWSVRCYTWETRAIETVGGFGAYATRKAADAAAYRLAAVGAGVAVGV